MSDAVWISKVMLDTRLMKPMSSNLDAPRESMINYWKGDAAKVPSGSWPCPTEAWVDDDFEGEIGTLPDLFLVETTWVISRRLAEVLRHFDLGSGGLQPIKAFKKDRQTPLSGEYVCVTFGNVKYAFLPDESKNIRDFVRGVWSTRAVLFDDDIVCSSEALSGSDIWIDPRLYGSMFLSDRLVSALSEAKLAKAFDGPTSLKKCRVMKS